MKLFTFCIAVFMAIGFIQAQTHLYENPNFDQITADHKIIAITPFKTTITLRPKDMKDMSAEQLKKMEEDEGESVQRSMYTWFLKRMKKGSLDIQVQDPATTNALLKKAGVTYDNFAEFTPAEVAKILGVDAVITGTFETDKPMSDGASAALGLAFGVWGATNKAVINLFIYDADEGELLVNYNKGVSGSLGSSTDDIINVIMRKASRRVTYNDN